MPPPNQPPTPPPQQVIQGQNINQPVIINNVLTDHLSILVPVYPLQRYDYELLMSNSTIGRWKENVFFIAAGLLVNMVGKVIYSQLNNKAASLDDWEFYAWIFATIAWFCLLVVDEVAPNERKALIKRIKNCFNRK